MMLVSACVSFKGAAHPISISEILPKTKYIIKSHKYRQRFSEHPMVCIVDMANTYPHSFIVQIRPANLSFIFLM